MQAKCQGMEGLESPVRREKGCEVALTTSRLRQFGLSGVVAGAAADSVDAMGQPQLKKWLGQHHLRQGEVCAPLLDFLAPRGCQVVEVGPGGGVLTRQLVRCGARVLAIELDPVWAFALAGGGRTGVRLAIADALQLNWKGTATGTLVTGNLPYNVATAIIQRVVRCGRRIPRAGFLVQREVAERFTATVGSRGYGALTVLTSLFAVAQVLGRVKAGSFVPVPKVESAFVGFELRQPELTTQELERFERFIYLAFSQKRKQLVNALGSGWGHEMARDVLGRAEVDPERRAETLPLAEFLRVFEFWRGR